MITILVLAAGLSSRMRGPDKLLMPIDGQPLLRRTVQRAVGTNCAVRVVLPASDHPRNTVLEGLKVDKTFVVALMSGMGQSIRAGVMDLPENTDAVMILPADMPQLTTADLCTCVTQYKQLSGPKILRAATSTGRAGHPVIFPKQIFGQLINLNGPTGARDVVKNYSGDVDLIRLPDAHAVMDLDTPEDWEKMRTAQKNLPS